MEVAINPLKRNNQVPSNMLRNLPVSRYGVGSVSKFEKMTRTQKTPSRRIDKIRGGTISGGTISGGKLSKRLKYGYAGTMTGGSLTKKKMHKRMKKGGYAGTLSGGGLESKASLIKKVKEKKNRECAKYTNAHKKSKAQLINILRS